MRKSFAALPASFALALGVGLGGHTPASAAYPPYVNTAVSAASKTVNERATFKLTVKVKAGSARVSTGKVTVIFDGRSQTKSVVGGAAAFRLKAPSVKKTITKTAKLSFKPASGSIFKKSRGSTTVKVKNKK